MYFTNTDFKFCGVDGLASAPGCLAVISAGLMGPPSHCGFSLHEPFPYASWCSASLFHEVSLEVLTLLTEPLSSPCRLTGVLCTVDTHPLSYLCVTNIFVL